MIFLARDNPETKRSFNRHKDQKDQPQRNWSEEFSAACGFDIKRDLCISEHPESASHLKLCLVDEDVSRMATLLWVRMPDGNETISVVAKAIPEKYRSPKEFYDPMADASVELCLYAAKSPGAAPRMVAFKGPSDVKLSPEAQLDEFCAAVKAEIVPLISPPPLPGQPLQPS